MNLSSTILLSFTARLEEFYTLVYPSLMQSFGFWIRLLLLLYILIVGYMLIMGKVKENMVMDFIVSVVLLVLIYSCIMESSFYIHYVKNPLMQLTEDLGGFFIDIAYKKSMATTGGIVGALNRLDRIYEGIFIQMVNLSPKGSIFKMFNVLNIINTLQILILIAIYAIMHIAFLILLIMAYFSIYIMHTLGGIFIFCAAFKKTRFIFFTWLRAILNYSVLIVMLCMVMSVCIYGIDASMSKITTLKDSNALLGPEYILMIVWCLITLALLLKAPDYAAALTGGQAGSTAGIAMSISKMGGMAAGLTTAGAGLAAKKGLSGIAAAGKGTARTAWDHVQRPMK